MIDVTTTTTVLGVIALLVLATLALFGKPLLAAWDQKRSDLKRTRAHAGKVKCEEKNESCDKTAVALTYNGYYCHDHWEQNSKQMVNGGYVTWHHSLYHAVRRG